MGQRRTLQRRLLSWYGKHQRDLPWRRTKNPYHILVSEMMLQQTQVDRVIPKYQVFLQKFPTLRHLARARQGSVITAWSGLGYNRRARNLHQLAKQVVKKYDGTLPRTPQELQQLPGIGPYTSAAVACFAFGAPVALVDVNVRRVLGRVYHGVTGPQRITEPVMWQLASEHVPSNSVAWNSALMDFGATMCTARTPKCAVCPLQKNCAAYPAILTAPAPVRAKQQSFTDSDRYWRGKIIAMLQTVPKKSSRTQALQQALLQQGLGLKRFRLLLTRLTAEQLVRRKGEIVRL
ncbi:MAG: A/G-specific adenine glycosylase [Patescibacteria group bacterium]